jgi:hypothetical protein
MRDMPERLQGGNKVSVQQFPQKINYENENGFNFKNRRTKLPKLLAYFMHVAGTVIYVHVAHDSSAATHKEL